MSLKIEVSNNCTGHGRCYMLAPALFEPDDEGFGVPLRHEVVTDSDISAARAAAAACPEAAVLLTDV